MSNTKNIRNIFLAVAALVLTGAIFTGCGRNEKTGNECGKTEVFADDLQKGNAAFEAKDYETAIKHYKKAAVEGLPSIFRKKTLCPLRFPFLARLIVRELFLMTLRSHLQHKELPME